MFTPIGFFAPSGWSFGGVTDGLQFAYEAESTTDQGVWTDTSGNGYDGSESGESNNGITHYTDANGNYWFFDYTSAGNYDSNYVSTGYAPGTSVPAFSFCVIQQWDAGPYDPSGTTNTGPLFECSTGNNTFDLFHWVNAIGGTGNSYLPVTIIENGEFEPAVYNFGSSMRNKWWMLTTTWDGSNIKNYLNTTNTRSGTRSVTLNCGTATMNLHRFCQGDRNRSLQELQMGAFAWYNKALSASEISTNYTYFQEYYTGL
jgi:hypothetical protein